MQERMSESIDGPAPSALVVSAPCEQSAGCRSLVRLLVRCSTSAYLASLSLKREKGQWAGFKLFGDKTRTSCVETV